MTISVAQARSDTALFAYVASKLEGKTVEELPDYATTDLKVFAGQNAIRKALRAAARIERLDPQRKAVRPWLRVDAQALDFFMALVRLRPAAGRFGGLEREPGVLRLFKLEGGELLAIVLYERRSDRDRLRTRLGELAEVVSWEEVSDDTEEPSIVTWRALTVSAARREGLQLAADE